MSYFSEIEYRAKTGETELWFDRLYFNRWFPNAKGPILDIGCATGNFIALNPEIIEGVDIDDDSLEIAKKRGFRVRKINAQQGLMELAENYYEGIYAKHVIEHLPDALNLLQHSKRILKPGGKAIILTPNWPYMLSRAFYDDYTHLHPFTAKSLHMAAFDAGFSQVKITEDFRCFPGLGRIMRFTKMSPEIVAKIQRCLGWHGLSLILEVTKD